MKDKIISAAIVILLLSCNQQNNSNSVSRVSGNQIVNDSLKNGVKKTKDTLLQKSLYPGSDTLFFKLKMDSLNRHLIIPVYISKGKELFASLSSNDRKANIRISQIGSPDSTFDGPFGRNIQYKIKMAGNYKIIIGENMMAGDPWKGDFSLKVWMR